MGKAFKELGVQRKDIVISTKIFWEGFPIADQGPNGTGLSRAKIVNTMQACLKRLQVSYVDIVYCHRFDYETPLLETCEAMSWCVQ